MRIAKFPWVALFLALGACTSDDNNEDDGANASESESVGATVGESETSANETETGELACGVASGVCCENMEPCEVTEDCCEPGTYTCYLVGTTMQCADLAMLCQQCIMNCPAAPDVCEMSCAVFCNPDG